MPIVCRVFCKSNLCSPRNRIFAGKDHPPPQLRHFMAVNNCDQDAFEKHKTEATRLRTTRSAHLRKLISRRSDPIYKCNEILGLIRSGSKNFYCDRDGGCDYCNQEDQIGVIAKETHA
jgi:hypothetical protein